MKRFGTRFIAAVSLVSVIGLQSLAAGTSDKIPAVPAGHSSVKPLTNDAVSPLLLRTNGEEESRAVSTPSVLRVRTPKVLDAVQAELPGVEVGFTYYDFQTNGAMANRLVYTQDGPDKYVQMVWMASKDSTRDLTSRIPGFAGSARGTHYTFLDVSNPDAPALGVEDWQKVEVSRSGWPSLIQFKDGLIGTPSHPPIRFFGNSGVGDQPIQYAEVTDASSNCLWPRAAADGDGNAHIIYNNNLGSDAAPSNQIGYRRSIDGGFSWSEETLFTGSTAPEGNMPVGLGGDTYAVTARGKKVVITYTDNSLRTLSRTSTDGGATWPTDLARVVYSPNWTDIDSANNEWGTFEVRTDTMPTPNGHVDVIIDNDGNTHYVMGLVPGYIVRKDTNGARSGTIFILNDIASISNSGLGYRNETDNFIFFMGQPAGSQMDGNGYVMNNRFFDGGSRWPQLGIDAQNNLYCAYGSWKNGDVKSILADTTAGNQQSEPDTLAQVDALNGHIWITYKPAAVNVWSTPYDMTPNGVNCQYPSLCDDVMNGRLYIGYSASPTPGDRVTNLETNAEAAKVMFYALDATKLPVVNSVDPEPLQADVTIAPNPVREVANVRIVSKSQGAVKVSIMTSIGEMVMSSVSPNDSGTFELTIPTQALAAGMYQCVIEQAGARSVHALSVVR
ncbi:MAG: T9SS type A sorting domain-containing protein [Ignavibacteria bacterium]|jgi:hypothetical protein